MGRVGPRGLSPDAMLAHALALIEDTGEAGFSLRRLAARIGCDPMAVLHHFDNKDGLRRRMADALVARLAGVDDALPWQDRLREMARNHRQLALSHPQGFALIQEFWNTGIADFAQIEAVQRALRDAGVPQAMAPSVCLGWYGCVIGLCMAEIRGMIRPPSDKDAAEIAALPAADYPLLHGLLPVYATLDPEGVFETTQSVLIDGIAAITRN